jgi:hypothetical protein
MGPGIDTKASIPPAYALYAAWRAGTITPIPTRCLGPIDFFLNSSSGAKGNLGWKDKWGPKSGFSWGGCIVRSGSEGKEEPGKVTYPIRSGAP